MRLFRHEPIVRNGRSGLKKLEVIRLQPAEVAGTRVPAAPAPPKLMLVVFLSLLFFSPHHNFLFRRLDVSRIRVLRFAVATHDRAPTSIDINISCNQGRILEKRGNFLVLAEECLDD